MITEKQKLAFRYLLDNETTELLFGGGAGGGKSRLGAMWVLISALKFHGTRWLIGRSILKNLKETTLVTLFDVMREWGLEPGVHYDYNTKDNFIQFKEPFGGSVILLKDLFAYPSDPEFDSLGSLEVTGSFIDEGSQVSEKSKNIVTSRIRYKLDSYCMCGYPTAKSKVLERKNKKPVRWLCKGCGQETRGLLPKILITTNPAKNWVYEQFYRKWKDGVLPEYRKYIPALPQDNPFIHEEYIKNLEKLDENSKQRLLYGNWEYDDDDSVLMEYDNIVAIFQDEKPHGKRCITCDFARFGKDKTVILVWDGWNVIEYRVMPRTTTQEAAVIIRSYMARYGILRSDVLVDEMGTGSGLVDLLGCRGFVASAQPVFVRGMKEVYQNLKAQCAFRFAEKVNRKEVFFKTQDVTVREIIVKELEQIKRKDPDKDGKLNIVGKDVMRREMGGRSTDFFDALAMRIYLDIKSGRRFLI